MSEKFIPKVCFFIFLSLLMIGVGCSKNADPVNFVNIDDQYELLLHQQLTINGGIPSLKINTLNKQECENAYISHYSSIDENKIEVFINDILVEGECISGNQIISEEIDVNTSNSAIPIEITLREVVKNRGTLFSDKSEFELVLNEFDGLKISKTHINRVRPKMIWGSFQLSNEAVKSQLSQYLHSLDMNVSHLIGDYGHFYLSQEKAVTIYENEVTNAISFLISTNEDFENINTKIQHFKTLDESLFFHAINYDGSTLKVL